MFDKQDNMGYQIPIHDRLLKTKKAQMKSEKMLLSKSNNKAKIKGMQDIEIDTLEDTLINENYNKPIFSAQYSAISSQKPVRNFAVFDSNNSSSDVLSAESITKKYNLLASQHVKNKHYYAGVDISKISNKAFNKAQRKSTSLLKPATPITNYNKNKLMCLNKHNWSHKDYAKDNTESDTESYLNITKSMDCNEYIIYRPFRRKVQSWEAKGIT